MESREETMKNNMLQKMLGSMFCVTFTYILIFNIILFLFSASDKQAEAVFYGLLIMLVAATWLICMLINFSQGSNARYMLQSYTNEIGIHYMVEDRIVVSAVINLFIYNIVLLWCSEKYGVFLGMLVWIIGSANLFWVCSSDVPIQPVVGVEQQNDMNQIDSIDIDFYDQCQ